MSAAVDWGRLVAVDAGQLLNSRYRLAERLGEGGMSVVWLAHDEVLDRAVAVKALAGEFAADPDWRRRIRLEARAAARLSHPNVTNVYDYGETADHHPFVVMELLRGPTLAQRLESGPLSPAATIRICAEVAAGLAAAHAVQLVHRDVKPANVVLTVDAAKLVDFGIVGFAGDPGDPDPAAPVLGTPAYLAPERLRSDQVTPASDVYAFGLLLYRSLTGRLPWSNETVTQIVLAHVTVEPAPLPELVGVPVAVRELCLRCLAKEPADRPDAAAVASALAEAAGIVPRPHADFSAVPLVPAPPAAGPTAVVPRRARAGSITAPGESDDPDEPQGDRRRTLAGFGIMLAIAALLVGFVLARPSGTPQAEAEAARGAPAVIIQAPSSDPAAPASAGGETAPALAGAGQSPSAGPGPAGGGLPGGAAAPPGNLPGNGARPVRLPTLGGVIVAVCAGKKVSVLQVTPGTGSQLVKAEQGERTKSRVEFARGGTRLRFEVSCIGGVPAALPD